MIICSKIIILTDSVVFLGRQHREVETKTNSQWYTLKKVQWSIVYDDIYIWVSKLKQLKYLISKKLIYNL